MDFFVLAPDLLFKRCWTVDGLGGECVIETDVDDHWFTSTVLFYGNDLVLYSNRGILLKK